MNTFDQKARNWDKDPARIARTETFARNVIDFMKPDGSQSALEFGCGTGLLGFALKDHFKSVTLADTSAGMLEVVKEKIASLQNPNVSPLLADLLEEEVPLPPFDLLTSMLTFHHIPSPANAFQKLSKLIKTGGFMIIADVMPEDGSFHEAGEFQLVHTGFSKDQIYLWFQQAGLQPLLYSEFAFIEKNKDNKTQKYPLFWAVGRKL